LVPVAGTTKQTTVVNAHAAAPGKLTFWEELKRRKVYNVAVVYLAAAFGALGFLANLKELYGGTAWFKWLPVALLAGFPISLLLAWTFEISRDGMRRTGAYTAATRSERRWPLISRRALVAVLVIGVLSIVLVVVLRSMVHSP
jgi:hypothetical protein